MAVFYHRKHPLLSLERVCALTIDMAAVDSFILLEQDRAGDGIEGRPVMEFYETNEMGGQTDNWVGPSLECLLAFCRTAGFARVELRSVIQHSACLACFRRWPATGGGRNSGETEANPGPELIDATHNGNNYSGDQNGYEVPVHGKRSIWLQLTPPTSTIYNGVQQRIRVTVTAIP
jgi:hypothetical protein